MPQTIEPLLVLHSIAIGLILMLFARVLMRRGLFRWTTAGFWSWAALVLYLVLNPLASVLLGNLLQYELMLSMSGGIERGVWIMVVAALGIVAFFAAYLRTQSRPVVWRLRANSERISIPMLLVMAVWVSWGMYSLLVYRSLLFPTSRDLIIEGGRFTGRVSGYEFTGHTFLFVPCVFLLLSDSLFRRWLGWLMVAVFVVLSLPVGWGRAATVSIILAAALADALRRNRPRPRLVFVVAALILVSALQMRGHETWTLQETPAELFRLIPQAVTNIGGLLSSSDISMLASWYLESYIKDTLAGFDFGIPLLNYALTGWIPGSIFPSKYFLVDWLHAFQMASYPPVYDALMYGAKSSLIGSFYANGGPIAVIVMMGLMGVLSRKLDGMLDRRSPILVKATGISWLSLWWMVWGSHDTWGLATLGTLAMPSLTLWLVSPKVAPRKNRMVRWSPRGSYFRSFRSKA